MPRLLNRRSFAVSAAASVILGARLVGETRDQQPDPGPDDAAWFEALCAQGGGRVPKRSQPYVLRRSIMLPDRTRLVFEHGTEILWAGGPARGNDAWVLIVGNDCTIQAEEDGEFAIRSAVEDRLRWAVCIQGKSNVTILGLKTQNLNQVYTSLRVGTATYGVAKAADLCTNVRVVGGGSVFDHPMTGKQTTASCFLGWVRGWEVRDASYRNVPSGIQWWGGAAGPSQDGAPPNERKCRDGLIIGVTVDGALGAGIWGSMGENIVIEDCKVTNCGDVGCDAEGSFNIKWLRCSVRACKNGAFSEFFYCRNVLYQNCAAESVGSDPVLAYFGEKGSFSEGSHVSGGLWKGGSGGAAAMTARYGAVRGFEIDGQAVLENVVIDLALPGTRNIKVGKVRIQLSAVTAKSIAAVNVSGGMIDIDGLDIGMTGQPTAVTGVRLNLDRGTDVTVGHLVVSPLITPPLTIEGEGGRVVFSGSSSLLPLLRRNQTVSIEGSVG